MIKKDTLLVSVVIPAYNEEKHIKETLLSIRIQDYSPIESIVVANGCTDNTEERADEGLADIILSTEIKGISHAKNMGWHRASGDILIFLDADSTMGHRLVSKVVDAVKNGYHVGKAKQRPLDDLRLRSFMKCYWSEIISLTGMISKYIDQGAGAATFATRDLLHWLDHHDGYVFDEDKKVMEDVDFFRRTRKQSNFRLITDSVVYTSMRRFNEEGYFRCYLEDIRHWLNPVGKTRMRWER